MTSKPAWWNFLREIYHVGFFVFSVAEFAATTKGEPWAISEGMLIGYIGGGLLTLAIVAVLVVFVLRR